MDSETPDSPQTGAPGQTEYRVVPFVAKIPENAGAGVAAGQLQEVIQYWGQSEWQYVRLETVETHIAGSAGCFGLGATPPKITAFRWSSSSDEVALTIRDSSLLARMAKESQTSLRLQRELLAPRSPCRIAARVPRGHPRIAPAFRLCRAGYRVTASPSGLGVCLRDGTFIPQREASLAVLVPYLRAAERMERPLLAGGR